MVTTIFFTIIFMIPIYGLLIWAYCCPEESILFGSRWMYKEEPEISRTAIRYTRFASITSMVVIPIVLIIFSLEIYVLRLVVVAFPVVFLFGFLKIYSDEKEQ